MTFSKDPDAKLDFTLSWLNWLGSDRIDIATWFFPGNSDTLSIDAQIVNVAEQVIQIQQPDRTVLDISHPARTFSTVWLSGGLPGGKYEVTCHVTTVGGRIDDRTITINVKER
jgi:hypothetical protein